MKLVSLGEIISREDRMVRPDRTLYLQFADDVFREITRDIEVLQRIFSGEPTTLRPAYRYAKRTGGTCRVSVV